MCGKLLVAQVVGMEREIALHYRSREYLAHMYKLYAWQTAHDKVKASDTGLAMGLLEVLVVPVVR